MTLIIFLQWSIVSGQYVLGSVGGVHPRMARSAMATMWIIVNYSHSSVMIVSRFLLISIHSDQVYKCRKQILLIFVYILVCLFLFLLHLCIRNCFDCFCMWDIELSYQNSLKWNFPPTEIFKIKVHRYWPTFCG